MVGSHSLFNKVTPGALHAAFRKFQVVFLRAARIRVPFKDQMGRRAILQILLVIGGQGVQRAGLAGQQPARGLGFGGLRRRKVNAVQRELRFELFHLRWFLDLHVAGSVGGSPMSVIDRALHRVGAGLQAGGIELHVRTSSGNLTARSRIAVGQRVVVRVAAVASDCGALARKN